MSSSEEEFESLIATRERRSNAGSRLKKLLEAEEDEVLGDEDENVKLLFAEEGEDHEWSEEEDSGDESGEEEESEQTQDQVDQADESDQSDAAENADSDEMLSSSEVSASDTDESEGERELQQQQKRQKRKKKLDIPVIRKRTTAKPVAKKRRVEVESGDRRLSTRKTTVENTQATHEKLVQMKQKQATTKVKVREEYVEKTLEENLEEAKETEEMNTISLNLFFQQEVEKKKKQRDLMNSKRFRLMEYMTFQSFGRYVTPQDEIDEMQRAKEREEYARRTTKRRGRRRKSEIERARLEEEARQREAELAKLKQEAGEADNEEAIAEDGTEAVEAADKTMDTAADESVVKEEPQDSVVAANSEEPDSVPKQDSEVQETEGPAEPAEPAEPKEPAEPLEGPPQLVAVSFLESHLRKDITRLELKSILFGPQSIVPGPHRDPHAQTIYTIKRDFQKELDLKKHFNDRQAVYEKLLQLPKFGEKYHAVENLDVDKQTDDNVVNITTPAPLGIYLPNGGKKQCPINGEDAMYYDPSNGVPYNSVEGYKVLKLVAGGSYFWTQIDNGGVNSVYKGGIGCYFGRFNDRHAEGVPEGFAG